MYVRVSKAYKIPSQAMISRLIIKIGDHLVRAGIVRNLEASGQTNKQE